MNYKHNRATSGVVGIGRDDALSSAFFRKEQRINDPTISIVLAPRARGIVMFAHDCRCTRGHVLRSYSPAVFHNHCFATAGLATGPAHVDTEENSCAIASFAQELIAVCDWLRENPSTQYLRIGCFATGICAAAAMVAAVERPDTFSAIVSFDGDPDRARPVIRRSKVPTLFISWDDRAKRNLAIARARAVLRAESELVILPTGALIEREPLPWALATMRAVSWFQRHVATGSADAHGAVPETIRNTRVANVVTMRASERDHK